MAAGDRKWWHFDTWDLKHKVVAAVIASLVAAIIFGVFNGLSGDGSADEASTSKSTSVPESVSSLFTPPTTAAVERDPRFGETRIGVEESEDFFDGDVVVSIGEATSDSSGAVLSPVTIRVGSNCWRFFSVRTGDAFRLESTPEYEIQVRSLRFYEASFVVLRHVDSAADAVVPNC